MATTASSNSTTVLHNAMLSLIRLGFRLGGLLLPTLTVHRAARVMTTPMKSSRQRAKSAHTSARAFDLAVGRHRLKVYVWGDPARQPYVLFAHGWSSYGLRFEPWVAPLRDAGYAVVSFDQQAHGLSSGMRATAPDFAENLAAIGTHFGHAAAAIGHSLGGAAVVRALRHGLSADRVVLIAPAGDMVAVAERFARFVGLAEHLCVRMIRLFERRSAVTFAEQQAERSVRAIAHPLLVIHDLADRDVPWEEGERYVRHASDGYLLSTNGLGHHRIATDPAVMKAALDFLEGGVVGNRVVSSPNLPYGVF